jgi:hypothetical protein
MMLHPSQYTSTTPKKIAENVYRLREILRIHSTPVFVPVRPQPGCRVGSCFHNVGDYIAARGGSVQHGWLVWECPGRLIEAEFHAMWVSPAGVLEDITPKPDGEEQVLFIPDAGRFYEGRPVPNVRSPLAQDANLERAIRFAEELDHLRARYHQGGVPQIPQDRLFRLVQGSLPKVNAL